MKAKIYCSKKPFYHMYAVSEESTFCHLQDGSWAKLATIFTDEQFSTMILIEEVELVESFTGNYVISN